MLRLVFRLFQRVLFCAFCLIKILPSIFTLKNCFQQCLWREETLLSIYMLGKEETLEPHLTFKGYMFLKLPCLLFIRAPLFKFKAGPWKFQF